MIENAVPPEIAAILDARGAAIGEIALRLRSIVRAIIPAATEQADPAAGLVAYAIGPRLADTVCVIAPQRTGVNFGLYRALELPDTTGLLAGSGKLHRHVKVRSLVDAENPGLRALLDQAVIRARARKGP
jgi:hypothetical protein